ncbi:choice-of-anchor K domain-containing protein [Brasilonema octagenarum]|uniref:PEP-CTERM sorting domain-containing protein n=1 Tax=Brasilonema octagenarum UFV-OR1 TaxID=417115 RepID=A0ABX1M4A1_9CYAN|nr:choice-of-anchor K domain-containing protein [Brasilonema octagenarum]NMF62386.1 PEP-CTERM sorting domain-containing protein [Brasilonema octagenarum UFV-OR1]
MKLSSVFAAALSTFAVTLITALGFSNQAQGLTILGNSSGIWGTPDPGSNTDPVFSGVGMNSFTWGRPHPDDFENNYGTPANQLTFTGNPFWADDVGSLFKVGDLEYYNGKVEESTSVDSVPLNLTLSFTNPGTFREVFNFGFQLVNTPNLGQNPEDDADIVYIKDNFSTRSFNFEGNEYQLNLIGFSQNGGNTPVNKFSVLEGDRTTAGIYARMTRITPAKQTPEPAGIVGLSVLGIYLVTHKKSLGVKKRIG